MRESRWLRWIGPGVVALWAALAIASATAGARMQAWTPRACAGTAGDLVGAVRSEAATTAVGARGGAWYRLDPDLGPDGWLRGERLALGVVGQPLVRTIALPAESFAAGPFGSIILVGSDDGRQSRLQAVDVAGGCAWSVGESADVIRRAIVDPAGSGIVEMRVARVGRADLGVWRRSLDRTGDAVRVLAPPAPDPRFGRTFSTEFVSDVTGTRMAVQSCGETACRTRLLDGGGVPVGSIEDAGLGTMIGLDGDRVVTYAACRGLPCPIVVTDARSGIRRVLVADGGPAVVVDTPTGSRLIDETYGGTEAHLRSTGLADGAVTDLGPIPAGHALVPGADRSASATRVPTGWILLAPEGRLPADAAAPHPLFRRVPDGLTVPFDEAIR